MPDGVAKRRSGWPTWEMSQRAHAALGAQGGHRRVARRRMVEDRVERPVVVAHGKKSGETRAARRARAGSSIERPRLARRLQHLRHQVEMRVGALAAELLEPRRCPAARRRAKRRAVSFMNRSWLTTRSVPREALRDAAGVGERRQHVGAEEQQHAHACRRRRASVMRDIWFGMYAPRRAAARAAAMLGEVLAVARRAVARAEAAAGDAEVARSARAGSAIARAGLPAVGALVHRAAAEHDHGGSRRRIAARERDDPRRPGRR